MDLRQFDDWKVLSITFVLELIRYNAKVNYGFFYSLHTDFGQSKSYIHRCANCKIYSPPHFFFSEWNILLRRECF